MVCTEKAKSLPEHQLAVAFYNLDNLFDDVDNSDNNDQQFTPNGTYQWTSQRFQQKINNLNKVISQIANGNCPDALGVCELENENALKQLIEKGPLNEHHQYVHYESPDERGIDVALIYNSQKLTVLQSKAFPLKFDEDSSDETRDILWVMTQSTLSKDTFHFIVAHFPSRREGKNISETKRLQAAQLCVDIIEEKVKNQHLIILGDFNDQANDKSMEQILGAKNHNKEPNANLFNLMFDFKQNQPGSYYYRGHWERLDQIIVSHSLRDQQLPDYQDSSVNVMYKDWLIQTGKYAGYPLRTFGGKTWLNGYSDHLPVYMVINLK
jgi:predicted extracellular nuclease